MFFFNKDQLSASVPGSSRTPDTKVDVQQRFSLTLRLPENFADSVLNLECDVESQNMDLEKVKKLLGLYTVR